ncbi:MAG: hypothetical protein GY745_05665 [Actinomycetia bacterium]|nr:hypothetical protein [Actinomycetes bacterium]
MTDLEDDVDGYSVEIVDDTLTTDARGRAQVATTRPVARIPDWVLVLGGLVLVVAVIMVTAQPSEPPAPPVPTSLPPPATFVPPSTTAPEPDSDDEIRFGTVGPPATLPPLEPFADTLPVEVPGQLLTFGSKGRLVVIDRTLEAPFELRTGSANILTPRVFATPDEVILGTGSRVLSVPDLVPDDYVLAQLTEGRGPLDLRPGSIGALIITTTEGATQTASPLVVSGIQPWHLPTGVEVVGEWKGQLLVSTPGRTSLVDATGAETHVDVGRILAYDGQWLAHVTCAVTAGCEIRVGTPDEPNQAAMALPGPLASARADTWGDQAAISPDGTRVGVASDGGAPVPIVVDFATGEWWIIGDGMNPGSPMVFSPDGQWLAYGFQTDVTVWRIEGDRSWRIDIARPVGALAWR